MMSKVKGLLLLLLLLPVGSFASLKDRPNAKPSKPHIQTLTAIPEKWTVVYEHNEFPPLNNYELLRINGQLFRAMPVEEYFGSLSYDTTITPELHQIFLSKNDLLWKSSSEYKDMSEQINKYNDLSKTYNNLLDDYKNLQSQAAVLKNNL